MINKLIWRYKDFLFNKKLLSFRSLVNFYTAHFLGKKLIGIRIKGNTRKFFVRINNKIDRTVLAYVFYNKYHLPPVEYVMPEAPVIVDLGANIGCTVVDFKIRYSNSIIFAYEMHFENLFIAEKNCYELQGIHLFNKAIWTKKGKVAFSANNTTDAYFVNSSILDENAIQIACLSIQDILHDNNLQTIDFLKMDIEGAEKNILDDNDLEWLNHTNSLNIEFHNISADRLEGYIRLFQQFGFNSYRSPNHWLSILGYKPVL